MKTETLRAMLIPMILVLSFGCSGNDDDDDTQTPTPTATLPQTGNQAAIEAVVEDKAWGGVLAWQNYTGSPSGGSLRMTMNTQLHIYEYEAGYWCGYMYRNILTAERYTCTPFCSWDDRMDDIDEPTTESVAWGVIRTDPSDSTHYEFCAWIGPLDERGPPPSPPSDPDAGPDRTLLSCDASPEITGYFDNQATNQSAILFQFDGIPFSATDTIEVDFPPTNLSAISLNGKTQTDWCGTWITSL